MGNSLKSNENTNYNRRSFFGFSTKRLFHFHKISSWSLSSLVQHLHWKLSESVIASCSFSSCHQKSTSSYKGSKTKWPKPKKDSIFLSHFRRSSKDIEILVKNILAKGTFGIVFKVETNQNLYALKILNKSKIIEESAVEQVKSEIEIQKICSHHPFIVKLFDSWQNSGSLHISPEILTGCPYEHSIDWWALGIIACRMFTNKYPNTRELIEEKHAFSTKNESQTVKRLNRNVDNISDIHIVQKNNSDQQTEFHKKFLPIEVNSISKEGKELLSKLLEYEPKSRIKSVLALQKLAMFKNFKIEVKSLLKISPIKIMNSNKLHLILNNESDEFILCKYFNDF